MSRSPIPRHRALLAGFCLAGALSAQAATQEEILDAALVSGDSSQPTDSHLVALRLQQQVERIRQTRTQLLDGLYQNLSQAYDPGAASMWVLPANPDNTLPFLIGDKGRVLASLSLEAGGRGLAYGTNVLTQLSGANAAHAPLLKRAVQWLVNGDPGAATAKDFKVSVVGVDKTAALNGLKSAGLQPADAACNALTDASCASASKLLVLGNGASAASLSATVRARLQAGLPILFVHTNGWNQSSTGQQILAGLGLQEGPYGGNYWDKDRVPSSRTRTRSVELGGAYGQDPALVQQIVDGSWRTDYDWSKCTSYVGRTTCDDVPGLSDFSKRVDVLKGALDAYNQKAQNLFALPGTTSLRLWLLWADAVRQNIRYPMDKAADTARFQETFVADAIVGYVRETGAAQKELGSYAGQRQQSMPVSGSEETLTLTLPSAQGFTAIGRMAAPGKRLSIRIEDAGQASLAVGLNTQRIGSTRLWNTRQYDRPRFLKSPDIKLQANQSVALVSPYGGLLQLVYSGATPGQTVTVKVTGAASQPFLDIQPGEDSSQAIADFIQALDADKADWLEIRSGSVEVHAKVEKVRGSIDKDYGGDVQRFIRELNEVFIDDAYTLAGFAIPNQAKTPAIQQECAVRGWDCDSETLHKLPGTQHINVDQYAQCGGGCSGNPYDQTWGLNPRGWGESHELGHNLQVNRLKVYGGRSGEISNQIFPLHKGLARAPRVRAEPRRYAGQLPQRLQPDRRRTRRGRSAGRRIQAPVGRPGHLRAERRANGLLYPVGALLGRPEERSAAGLGHLDPALPAPAPGGQVRLGRQQGRSRLRHLRPAPGKQRRCQQHGRQRQPVARPVLADPARPAANLRAMGHPYLGSRAGAGGGLRFRRAAGVLLCQQPDQRIQHGEASGHEPGVAGVARSVSRS